ncbi:MAG: hypothetical protein PQJ60_04810 [Spirochaetales bacterium]|nr:hypothetical protein [Spirochaetales bacterium]
MKKIVLLTLLALTLFGCATSIPVQMTVPPTMDYEGARTVGVLPFTTWLDDATLSDGLGSYYRWYHSRELNEEVKLASYLSSNVESVLASTDYFTVLSSDQLQKEVSQGDLSVEVIVTGKITSILDDYEDTYETATRSDGSTYRKVTYRRDTQVTVNVNILDAKTLTIIDTKQAVGRAESTADDYDSLDTREEVQHRAIDEVMKYITYGLIPKTYTEYRKMEKLADPKDPRVETIDGYIKGHFYEDAYALYREIYRENNDWAALYNSILLVEVMGAYDRAIEEMTQLAKESANQKAIDQMNRMITQRENREALAAE